MNKCVGCESPVGVFTAFCTQTCEGIWGLQMESVPPCCPEGTMELAGFTARGVPALKCPLCGGLFFDQEHAEREIVVPVGGVPTLAQKLEAMRLQGMTRGVA